MYNEVTWEQVNAAIEAELAPIKDLIEDLKAFNKGKGEAVQQQPTAADAYLQWQEKTKGKDLSGTADNSQQPTPQTGSDTITAYFEEKARQQGKPLTGLQTEDKII